MPLTRLSLTSKRPVPFAPIAATALAMRVRKSFGLYGMDGFIAQSATPEQDCERFSCAANA
jgi:hypothetical protein